MSKKQKIGLILLYSLIALLAVAVIVYLCYELFVLRVENPSGSILRAALLLASLAITVSRVLTGPRRRGKISPAVYRKHYKDLIGRAFSDDPKREKRFFRAVDEYQNNRYAPAVRLLHKVEGECTRNEERFAVLVFMALCYNDMGMYQPAATLYERALTMRENATAASNLGLCYQTLGQTDRAIEAYRQAIAIAPESAYPYNNLAQLYIKQGNYQEALSWAKQASERNTTLYQAYSAQAVAYAMLGEEQASREALARYVANGGDGAAVKAYIDALQEANA
ncbi:MAG: tetratricopeptide repeat protein [Clostridia bacterium]|nr:tetratricopeptide repeat protein [Clostridia bacterium]